MNQPNKICAHCGYVGKPIAQTPGSFFIDALIWMFNLSVIGLLGIFPIIIFPIIYTTYHIYTYWSVNCPECECYEMVSLDSEKGKKAKLRFKK